MKPFIPRSSAVLSAAAVAFALSGCGSKHEGEREKSTILPTASVRVQTIRGKPYAITEEVVGTVQSKRHATLEAEVSGRIAELPIVLGQGFSRAAGLHPIGNVATRG